MTDQDQSREAFYAWLRTYEEEVGALDDPSAKAGFTAGWQAAHEHKAAVAPTTEESSGVVLPEPDASVYTMEALVPGGREVSHVTFHRSLPAGTKLYTEQTVRALLAAAPSMPQEWLPIESAPKDKTILLGYRNSHGHWRTLRGEWFTREEIDEYWEDPDGVEPGWFETSVEADDVPNVWRTKPTHWMPLPQPPKEQT